MKITKKLLPYVLSLIVSLISYPILEINIHRTGRIKGNPPKKTTKTIGRGKYSYYSFEVSRLIPFLSKTVYMFDEESLLKAGQMINLKSQTLAISGSNQTFNEAYLIRDPTLPYNTNQLVFCKNWKIESISSNTVEKMVDLADKNDIISKKIKYFELYLSKGNKKETVYYRVKNIDSLKANSTIHWALNYYIDGIFKPIELIWYDTYPYHHAPNKTDHKTELRTKCIL